MSLTCAIELSNNKYHLGKCDDPIVFFNFVNSTGVKAKRIVFVDECDMAPIVGQFVMRKGQNNIIIQTEQVQKPQKKGVENNGKKWTPEERANVFNDYKSKMDIKDIATKYKRTPGAIVSYIHTHIPKSTETYPVPTKKGDKWTPEENELLVTSFKNNTDMKTLVEKLGRSKRAIECHLIHLGVYNF